MRWVAHGAPEPNVGADREIDRVPTGRRRSWWLPVVSVAAAVAMIGGAVALLTAPRGRFRISPASPVTQNDLPSGATTLPAPSSTTRPSTIPASTIAVSSVPSSDAASVRRWDDVAGSVGVSWESAGFDRTCGPVWWVQQSMDDTRCTEIAIDPAGVPITFEPSSRLVSRHTRRGETVTFELPKEFVDPDLIVAGPDDVVYFALDNQWPRASDVLAVSVAADDAGSVLDRVPEAMGIGDADLFVTPAGLVLSGWHDPGFRPAHEKSPFVQWVRRNGAPDDPDTTFALAQFDDAQGMVTVGNRQWSLGGRLVVPAEPGTGRVLGTFDGGFIALYTEHVGDLRAEVFRGYRDGSVEHWLLPGSWFELGTPILEPQGTILLPDEDHFVRISPFAQRSSGWDGTLRVDFDTGTAEADGLNEFIDSYIASLDESGDGTLPWELGLTAFADAVAGPLTSPSELRTVATAPDGGGGYTVTVTTEGFRDDDSGFGSRLIVIVEAETDGRLRLGKIYWSQACQTGRGHQDYTPAPCS